MLGARRSLRNLLPLPALTLLLLACGTESSDAQSEAQVVSGTTAELVFTGSAKLAPACERCVQSNCLAQVNAFKRTPPKPLPNGNMLTPNDHAVCVANCVADESVDPIEGPMTYCDPHAGTAIVNAYNEIYGCAEQHCLPACSDLVVIVGERP